MKFKGPRFECEDFSCFYESQWTSHRDWYLAYRLLTLAFHGSWLSYTVYLHAVGYIDFDGSEKAFKDLFIYITYWQLFFINIYCVSSFMACLLERIRQGQLLIGDRRTNQSVNHHKVTWYFHDVSFITSLVCSISYWALFRDGNFSAWNVYNHGGAAVAMVADAFLIKFPTYLPNGIYYAQVALVYATFNWLLSATSVATDIYPMVNWRERPLVACCLLFVALPVVGGSVGTIISFGCYRLRMLLFGRLFGRGPEDCSPAFEKVEVLPEISTEI